jgi:hypothetical protein
MGGVHESSERLAGSETSDVVGVKDSSSDALPAVSVCRAALALGFAAFAEPVERI